MSGFGIYGSDWHQSTPMNIHGFTAAPAIFRREITSRVIIDVNF
jgi:hypothetical protein